MSREAHYGTSNNQRTISTNVSITTIMQAANHGERLRHGTPWQNHGGWHGNQEGKSSEPDKT
jgi:hypothetical protein